MNILRIQLWLVLVQAFILLPSNQFLQVTLSQLSIQPLCCIHRSFKSMNDPTSVLFKTFKLTPSAYCKDRIFNLRSMKWKSKWMGIRGTVEYMHILCVHFPNEMAHFNQNFRGLYFHRKAKNYSLSSSCLAEMKKFFHDLASLIIWVSLLQSLPNSTPTI